MKLTRTLSLFALFALLAVAPIACLASTITTVNFGTGIPGTIEGNSLTGTNYATTIDPAWGIISPPLSGLSVWESVQPNSSSPPIPYGTEVDFWFQFTLSGTPVAATMQLLVDDSAQVVINGVTFDNNLGSIQGSHCAASQPNCMTSKLYLISTPFLLSGLNQVDVIVRQDRDGTPFGLNLDGAAAVDDTQAPEPGTMLLLGGGFTVIGLIRRRKKG